MDDWLEGGRGEKTQNTLPNHGYLHIRPGHNFDKEYNQSAWLKALEASDLGECEGIGA